MRRGKWNNLAALILAAAMAFGEGGAAPAAEPAGVTETAAEAEAAAETSGVTETAAEAEAAPSVNAGAEPAATARESAVESQESGTAAEETASGTETAAETDADTASEADNTVAGDSAELFETESAESAPVTETESAESAPVTETDSAESAPATETDSADSAPVTETENPESAPAAGTMYEEDAPIGEEYLADNTAAAGPEVTAASISGTSAQNLYMTSDKQTIVWVKGVADGSTITLKAEVKNDPKADSVIYAWTDSNNKSLPGKAQVKKTAKKDGAARFTSDIQVKTSADVYGYFCTITIDNRSFDTLAYIVKDPLIVKQPTIRIHTSPYSADTANSGEANFNIKAESRLTSDIINPPTWEYSAWKWEVDLAEDSTQYSLDMKVTVKELTQPYTTVRYSLSSLYSPDEIYGKRTDTVYIDTADHKWSSWKVAKETTIWAEGQIEHACLKCGYKETQKVSKLTPTIAGNMKTCPIQKGKSTDKYKVTLASGDYIKKWESADRSVCTVNGRYSGECTINAKKKGKTTVTATAASGLSIKVTVKVQSGKVKTKSIRNLPTSVTLKKRKTKYLKPELYPLTSQYGLTYSSSDTKVATVNSKGKIKAKAPGKCTIKVTSGRKTVKIPVLVTGTDATKIYNVKSSYKLKKGKTRKLSVKLLPAGSTSKITYKSSSKKIVRVSKTGKLTAVKKGTAIITIKAVNLQSDPIVKKIRITVK